MLPNNALPQTTETSVLEANYKIKPQRSLGGSLCGDIVSGGWAGRQELTNPSEILESQKKLKIKICLDANNVL